MGGRIYFDNNGLLLTDMELLNRLQMLKRKIADEKDVACFLIATDKILVKLATQKPITKNEFISIKELKVLLKNGLKIMDKYFYRK